MGGPDGKIFGLRSWRTDRAQRGPCAVTEVFYHMTNLETNFLKVLTREAVRFCSRAVRLFPAALAQMRTALIRDFQRKQRKRSQGHTGHMIRENIVANRKILTSSLFTVKIELTCVAISFFTVGEFVDFHDVIATSVQLLTDGPVGPCGPIPPGAPLPPYITNNKQASLNE